MSKKVVAFRIEGRPSPCQRPRFSRGHVFKAPEQVAAQLHIATQARFALKDTMLEGPIEMRVFFYFEKPKKFKQEHNWFCGRPDTDNLIKQLKDACNSIVYKDDSQIVRIIAEKSYGSKSFTWVEFQEL